jgi:ATP phosphoribosyltransferase
VWGAGAAPAAALTSATLIWPATATASEAAAVEGLVASGATRRPHGLMVQSGRAAEVSAALTAAGLGPVTVSRPDFVFDVACAPFADLKKRVL